jgi:hypothetical protein
MISLSTSEEAYFPGLLSYLTALKDYPTWDEAKVKFELSRLLSNYLIIYEI